MKARVVVGPEAGVLELRDALRLPALPRLRHARGAARAARAHRRSRGATRARPTTSRWARAASARSSSRCSSSRWCAAGATPGCGRPRRAKRCAAIGERGLMEPAARDGAGAAYEFLRRARAPAAVLRRPADPGAAARAGAPAVIAEAMGFADYDALRCGARPPSRRGAGSIRRALRAARAPAAGRRAPHGLALRPAGRPRMPKALAEDLGSAGIAEPGPVARAPDRLHALAALPRDFPRSSRAKVDHLLPEVMSAAAAEGGTEATDAAPDRAARGDRPARGLPLAPRRVSAGAGARGAPHGAQPLGGAPARAPPDPARRAHAHRGELHRDRLGGRARGARGANAPSSAATPSGSSTSCATSSSATMLRFTIADIEGELPVMALSDELSALADLVLDVTLAQAAACGWDWAGARRRAQPSFAQSSATASWAARNWATARTSTSCSSTTRRALDDSERLARVAQRVNHWLTTLTTGAASSTRPTCACGPTALRACW